MNTKNSIRNAYTLLSALAGAAATFVLTLVVYGLLLRSYDLTALNYGVHALSCLANGFFVATVLRWGRFRGAGKGAVVGALTSFLTDAYFIGVSVAMFGSTTVLQGLLQAFIFAALNALVGAIAAAVQKNMYGSGDLPARPIFPTPFLSRKTGSLLLSGVIGGLLAIALTALIYAVILAPFLLSDSEDVNAASLLLGAKIPVFLLANISHGFLITLVLFWGGFYRPWQGALSAMAVAGMTDLYFGFRDVAVQPVGGIKEMTIASALQDTCIWMVLNLILGALLALILNRFQKQSQSMRRK